MKNKIITLMMISVLLLSMSFSFGDTLKTDLSYDEALALALENSNTLETIDNKILLAERELKSAVNKSDDVKTSGITSDSQLLENGKIKALYPSQKNRKLMDLKEERELAASDLEIEVLEQFNTVKNKKEALQFRKNDLITAEKEYEQMKVKYDLGMIIKNELFEYEIAVKSIESEINTLERDYRKALIDMNRLIGYPINTSLTLQKKVDLSIEALSYDLDAIVEKAKENSKTVRDAYNDYLLKDLEREVINRYSRYEKPDSYDDLKEEVIDLEEAYEDSKTDAAIEIYTDYYNLLNLEADVQIAALNLELADKSLAIQRVMFDNEMSIYLDYKKAVDSYRDAYKDHNDKKLELFKAKHQFDYTLEKLDDTFESVIIN